MRIRLQHRQFGRRKVRYADHVQRRQATCIRFQRRDQRLHQAATMIPQRSRRRLPQGRQALRLQRLQRRIAAPGSGVNARAGFPSRQPIAAIHEVLREHPRQPVGQLETPQRAFVPTCRRLKIGQHPGIPNAVACRLTQHRVQRPAQMAASVLGQRHRALAQHRCRQPVQPGAGQLHVQIADDPPRPDLPRQCAGKPLLHARVGSDDRLRCQRMLRAGLRKQRFQRPQQCLQPAGTKQGEAAVDFRTVQTMTPRLGNSI